MKKVSLIIALILITGLIFGCSKTTTPTTAPPVSETSKAPDTAGTATAPAEGGEKAAAEAYVLAWIEVQKDLDTLQKDWTDLMATADKLDKAELKTKLEEHMAKHDALKAKAEALKDKATADDTKKHQEAIIEVITLQVDGHKAAQEKYTKEGITPDEKTKLEAKVKEAEDAVKTKYDDAKKALEAITTKHEIKTEGATGGDTSASTATPADTGAPAASPKETTKE
ncbi:MAG: hypothetical protein AB2L14_00490 [Candidatus Xenobiia bacterium LiM19]